jgi:hypothetical protein
LYARPLCGYGWHMTSLIRVAALSLLLMSTAAPLSGQTTRTAQSTVDAYGARLANPVEPTEPLNVRRYNNRINSRVNNRISLRIERFRVDAVSDPTTLIRQRGGNSPTSSYRAAEIGSQQRRLAISDGGRALPNAYAFDDKEQAGAKSAAPRQ